MLFQKSKKYSANEEIATILLYSSHFSGCKDTVFIKKNFKKSFIFSDFSVTLPKL